MNTSEPETIVLTSNEIDVLRLLVKGLTDKEIAQILDLNSETVIEHMKQLLLKLKRSVEPCAQVPIGDADDFDFE